MDKITRMLILYSSLINGEEINKTLFCFNNDCSPRSFDRDIEDIRLFLSETFSVFELNYNRMNNTYYMKGIAKKQQFDVMEYLFIEKLLEDTALLRDDEFRILQQHLLLNTRDSSKMLTAHYRDCSLYTPPEHNKALLKLYGDLELAIRNQKHIKLVYINDNSDNNTCDFTPCCIRYIAGHLYLIGYSEDVCETLHIELDRVYSFEILRDQTITEKDKVSAYIRSCTYIETLKFGKDIGNIILECTTDDYDRLYNTFNELEILLEQAGKLKIRLNVNEDIFINWYLTHLSDTVTVVEPQELINRLIMQSKKLLIKYGGEE